MVETAFVGDEMDDEERIQKLQAIEERQKKFIALVDKIDFKINRDRTKASFTGRGNPSTMKW